MHIFYICHGHLTPCGSCLLASIGCQRFAYMCILESNLLACLLKIALNLLCHPFFGFQFNGNLWFFAATWYSENVFKWNDISFCLASLAGCWSFCCKVLVQAILHLYILLVLNDFMIKNSVYFEYSFYYERASNVYSVYPYSYNFSERGHLGIVV